MFGERLSEMWNAIINSILSIIFKKSTNIHFD